MSEIELHRKLLGDALRNQAFHAALRAVIEPGASTVVDVGAGTGFLSFLARRLGAAQCTLIEYSDALDLAQALARRNRIDGLTFIKAHSSEVRKPPKADVVVSETLGNFALEEGLLETLIDARRFLKAGGCLIPCRLRQFVAPVGSTRLQQEIDIWPTVGFDLDLAPARELSLNNMYVKQVMPADLACVEGLARCWDDLDLSPLAKVPGSRRRHAVQWRAGELAQDRVHGFALWWSAELIAGIRLGTSPFAPPTHWEQIYLPLLEAVTLTAQDVLVLELESDTRPEVGVRLCWHTKVLRKGNAIAEQRQDSRKGRL